jgi:hypothetical protein
MAPSVLGIGIPASSPAVPWVARSSLRKTLENMEADMHASPYDFEMFYVDTDMDFSKLTDKLREKKWDIVHIGGMSCPGTAAWSGFHELGWLT